MVLSGGRYCAAGRLTPVRIVTIRLVPRQPGRNRAKWSGAMELLVARQAAMLLLLLVLIALTFLVMRMTQR